MLSTNLSTEHLQTPEILEIIFTHLTLEEVKTVQEVCKKWNVSAKSPIVWEPYLNRLKALEPQICVLPPEKNYSSDWYYKRFVESFKQIVNQQQYEITRLLATSWGQIVSQIRDDIPATLQELEDRHKKLEHVKKVIAFLNNPEDSLPFLPQTFYMLNIIYPVTIARASAAGLQSPETVYGAPIHPRNPTINNALPITPTFQQQRTTLSPEGNSAKESSPNKEDLDNEDIDNRSTKKRKKQ